MKHVIFACFQTVSSELISLSRYPQKKLKNILGCAKLLLPGLFIF